MVKTAMPRLLYLLHSYGKLTGVELHAHALATALADRYEVAIAFPEPYPRPSFGADLTGYLGERRRMVAEGLARADALVTISPYLYRQLARIFPGSYRVIEYGIDPAPARARTPSPPRDAGAVRFG